MKKRIFIFLLNGCLGSLSAIAQDPVFSQAFLSPVYLNPAATGCGEYDLRISGIYRRHWWTIPSQINYMAFSIDKYLPRINSGIGVLATRSSEGYLNKNGIYGAYSFHVCSGTGDVAANRESPQWFWTGGLQFGVAQTRIDYNKLVFADQLNINGVVPGITSSADRPINNGKFYPDFAAGMYFNYNFLDNRRLLIGFSAHHINKPDESLTSTSDFIRSQLPIRLTGNILYTTTNDNETWTKSFGVIGYAQAKNRALQVGMEVTQNDYDISAGLWYRGSSSFADINAVTLTVSINLSGRDNKKDKMRLGIAHDAQTGSKGYSYTAGSSELGFVWDHNTSDQPDDNPCKPKISSTICPGVVRN